MQNKKEILQDAPLGLHFSNIAKQYLGVLTKKLEHIEIIRYFYPVVLIDRLGDNVTQQQLAELICVDKVFMVRIIDYLSKEGYVKRVRSQKDRREHNIELTSMGKKRIPDIKKALKECNEATLKGISEEETKMLFHLIGKIACNLSVLPTEKVDIYFKRV